MSGETEKVRIFLVEDHPVMRLGLKMMLQERGFHVCGEAASTDEAFKASGVCGQGVILAAVLLGERLSVAAAAGAAVVLAATLLVVRYDVKTR